MKVSEKYKNQDGRKDDINRKELLEDYFEENEDKVLCVHNIDHYGDLPMKLLQMRGALDSLENEGKIECVQRESCSFSQHTPHKQYKFVPQEERGEEIKSLENIQEAYEKIRDRFDNFEEFCIHDLEELDEYENLSEKINNLSYSDNYELVCVDKGPCEGYSKKHNKYHFEDWKFECPDCGKKHEQHVRECFCGRENGFNVIKDGGGVEYECEEKEDSTVCTVKEGDKEISVEGTRKEGDIIQTIMDQKEREKNNKELQGLNISQDVFELWFRVSDLLEDIRHRRLKKIMLLALHNEKKDEMTSEEEELWESIREAIDEYEI